jgi:hypothetical protein
LYDSYTSGLLEARSEVGRTIEPEKRLFFVTELAWEMQQRNEFTIHYSKFPDRLTAQFRLNDLQEVAFFDQDIRTQSYLVRDKEGNYAFGHKSFREFFVAKRLAELWKNGEAPQIPLTDTVVTFVHHLLAPAAGYELRTEDGMVLGAGRSLFIRHGIGEQPADSHDQGAVLDRQLSSDQRTISRFPGGQGPAQGVDRVEGVANREEVERLFREGRLRESSRHRRHLAWRQGLCGVGRKGSANRIAVGEGRAGSGWAELSVGRAARSVTLQHWRRREGRYDSGRLLQYTGNFALRDGRFGRERVGVERQQVPAG